MRPTICLNMIVKNEAHVIRRCLDSVRPLIDSWVIVDTGSTDGTRDIIRGHLAGVPGELFERPWKDFAHNRTEALELARGRGDYVLAMDADDRLALPQDFSLPPLTLDAYSLLIELTGTQYWRPCLTSTRLTWRYAGVIHEYLTTDAEFNQGRLEGPRIVCGMDGGRSKGIGTTEKYAKDARILEEALVEEPENERYVFYLAQSYRDAEQPKRALRTYQRRAKMGGWAEEVWTSLFQIAKLSEKLELEPAVIVHRYLEAYNYRPGRAEPLVELARYYREQKQFVLAHLFAERAICIPCPREDTLFLETAAYQWRAADEYAVACYWIGKYRECAKACEHLLDNPALPSTHLARVTENLNFALEKLPGKKTSIAPLIREAGLGAESFPKIEVKYSESMPAVRIGRP